MVNGIVNLSLISPWRPLRPDNYRDCGLCVKHAFDIFTNRQMHFTQRSQRHAAKAAKVVNEPTIDHGLSTDQPSTTCHRIEMRV